MAFLKSLLGETSSEVKVSRGKPRGIKPLLPSSARQNKSKAFVLPSLYVGSNTQTVCGLTRKTSRMGGF